MLKRISVPLALSILLMSCATKEADRPHATVTLRDGSTVAGSVVSSSAVEIAIAGDDKSSRTIPMNQVKSIEYDDPPQAAASQTAHQEHYHPPQSVVSTRTYQLPVGTEISVRAEETIDSNKGSEGQ